MPSASPTRRTTSTQVPPMLGSLNTTKTSSSLFSESGSQTGGHSPTKSVSPSAYGRTGSRKLVDLKQSKLAPFASVSACSVRVCKLACFIPCCLGSLSQIKRASVEDLLNKGATPDSDFETLSAVLDQYAGILDVLFSHYAWLSTQMGESSSGAVSPAKAGAALNRQASMRTGGGGTPTKPTFPSSIGTNTNSGSPRAGSMDNNAVSRHQFWRFVKDAGLMRNKAVAGAS